ncbi:MAG: hypothetical protein V9G19_07795 [Tetrasphaera sp.]
MSLFMRRESSVAVRSSTEPASAGPGARSGAVLAAATLIAGVLGYAFILILSRALGPERYGAVAALLGVALISTVTMTAVQLENTRLVASGRVTSGVVLMRHSLAVSIATALVVGLLCPLLVRLLHVDGLTDALVMASLLVPQTFSGGLLGILLGRGLTTQFGMLLVATGASRMLAAVATLAVGGDETFALVTAVVGGLAACALGVWQVLISEPSDAGVAPEAFGWAGLARAAAGAGALMVLLNADLLASRGVLPSRESGWYAFLVVFGRFTFWGTNFLSLWIFPHVAAKGSTTRAVRAALGVVVLVGAAAVLGAWLFGRPLVRLLAGESYLPAAGHAPAFATAGVLLAVVQLATYVDVARARHTVGIAVWCASLLLIVLIRVAAPPSVPGVVWTANAVLAATALVGILTILHEPGVRSRRYSARGSIRSSVTVPSKLRWTR